MAMGRRKKHRQQKLWVETQALAKAPGHPFYERLAKILKKHDFDSFVEERCQAFYAETMGRPSLPPAIYFRLLLIGFFEGIDSERGIAWRLADSISLRGFLGYELSDKTPNHSTISRTRRLIDVETHDAVLTWVLQRLAKAKLLKGKTLGIDATTLEANAAMRSIVRRDTGESYEDYLRRLAESSGVETPTRADLARFDRQRKGKKTSNEDWTNPHDPDARVTKMKDGRTRMGHKVEHAVDMETGAVVGITVQPADQGDTSSYERTLDAATASLEGVMADEEASESLSDQLLTELVADKGYHSNAVLKDQRQAGLRTYISEPDRGRRNWRGKREERDAVYANRRRVRGRRGRALLRSRGEKIERTFAHLYESGGMRRIHLRSHDNVLKRLLVQAAGFNLGLLLRASHGFGTPRAFRGLFSGLIAVLKGQKQRWQWFDAVMRRHMGVGGCRVSTAHAAMAMC